MKMNNLNKPSKVNLLIAFITLFAIATMLFLRPVHAAGEINTMNSQDANVVQNKVQKQEVDQVAIEGYDPVAYFTDLSAVKGSDEINHEWLGDKWLFSSEKNKQLFVMDAMAYMPNYGGYCSFDPVSEGHDHNVDPTVWRIVNDKLYLFYSEQTAGQKMHANEWKKVKAGLAQQ
jgi:hypothetical protein